MHKKFQMSSMGELIFFLGLQVKQKEDGIFISQDKYVTEILKKFSLSDVKTTSTPMETHKPLLKDTDGEDVDEYLYRSMIGSLMYLTSSRPDIMFAVCACARFQVNPKSSHLHAVKKIFRYSKGQPKLGFWYPKDSPFDLVAYIDSDYAGASLDRKSTTGGCLEWNEKAAKDEIEKGIGVTAGDSKLMLLDINLLLLEKVNVARHNLLVLVLWDTIKAKMVNEEIQLQALVDKKNVILIESTIRRDLQLEDANGVDCLPNAIIFKQLTLMGNMKREGNGFSGRVTPLFPTMMVQAQEEMGEEPIADEATNEENVPTQSNDPPLSRVNRLRSGEDILKLKELMDLCTKLSDRVFNLETTKTTQAKEIASLNKRFNKLERKNKSKTLGKKRLFKIGRSTYTQERNNDNLMLNTGVLDEHEVEVEKIKAAKPKVRGVMIQELSEFTTTTTTTTPAASKPSQDKGKKK
ncbi:uncharacterized mitochondrial protein-like protein [Tanacetum coccineum]